MELVFINAQSTSMNIKNSADLKAAIQELKSRQQLEKEQLAESFYGFKGDVPEGEYLVPIGKAAVRREGSDVTIVSFNKMMEVAKKAAEELAKQLAAQELLETVEDRVALCVALLEDDLSELVSLVET